MKLDTIDTSAKAWNEWNRQHGIIRIWIGLREWKLFLTLVDKKRQPTIPNWRSRFRSSGSHGYTEREDTTRGLLNRFRINLGIRPKQFYWIAKHEFGPYQDDPHIHVLIDYTRHLSHERIEEALQPIRDGAWMKDEGFDLCFHLKNDPDLPIFIQDLGKTRAYFGKDESDDTRSDKSIWSENPPKVDGALVFLNESFRKQCNAA